MLRRRFVVSILCSAAALCGFARTQTVSAWKGETVAALVEDAIELGPAPDGLRVRVGTLAAVRFAPKPGSLMRVEALDRVVWGDAGEGPRVVQVTVPPDAKPGDYDCGMLRIRVVDRTLPPAKDWAYFLDLWQHPWAVARQANAKPFSKEHYAAMRPVWELLASAGQKTLTVTLLDQPWNHQCFDAYRSMIGRVRHADGSWTFDYSLFDEYVAFGQSCGLGPEICCYTMCPWENVVRWSDDAGAVQSAVAPPGSEAFKDFWGDFLVDFARHLRAKGWFERTLISMDERTPEDVRAIADFIRAKAPGLRISMAGNRKPSDFAGVTIDVYSQILWDYCLTKEFLAEAAERRAKGFRTTYYVCCSPDRPNTFLDSGEGEAFWCGAGPAMLGLDGFLRWAWNSWPKDPAKDGSFGSWRSGDTFLCYPNGEPSWRFLELRNGIAAAEKVRILKAAGVSTNELSKLAARYDLKKVDAGKTDFRRLRADTISLVNQLP